MRITNTVLVLSAWAGSFALSRWQKSVSEMLDPINPHLADLILIGLFVTTFTVWFYDNKKNSPERQAHSKKFVKEIEILSKGHYGYYLNKTEFLIPYPYSEYKEFQRKLDYPTPSESIELFSELNWLTNGKEPYEFVPINKSPEGNFQQAMEHLQSYKHIRKMFDSAKKAEEECDQFLKNNQIGINEIKLRKINSIRKVTEEQSEKPESHPLYYEYKEMSEDYSDSLTTLQISLEIIASNLEDGKIIKGKCSKCP